MKLKIITLALSLVFGIQAALAQGVVTVVVCESDQIALSKTQIEYAQNGNHQYLLSSTNLTGFKFGVGATTFDKPIVELEEFSGSTLTDCVDQLQTLIAEGEKGLQRKGPQTCLAITFENGQVARSEDGTRDIIGHIDGSYDDDNLKRRVKCVSATNRRLAYEASRLFLWGQDL